MASAAAGGAGRFPDRSFVATATAVAKPTGELGANLTKAREVNIADIVVAQIGRSGVKNRDENQQMNMKPKWLCMVGIHICWFCFYW